MDTPSNVTRGVQGGEYAPGPTHKPPLISSIEIKTRVGLRWRGQLKILPKAPKIVWAALNQPSCRLGLAYVPLCRDTWAPTGTSSGPLTIVV